MKNRFSGSFIWTVLLGLFVLGLVYTARGFPDLLQFTPNLAGYGTLAMIAILIIGNFYPGILRWTETTLQDMWGGGKAGEEDAEAEEETMAQETPWTDVLRSISYALGFLISVFLLGFPAITPIYVTLYLVVEAEVRFIWAAMVGVFVTALIVTSMGLLYVEVWAGIIPEIIPGYLGGSILPPI
jgi:hypothetical protein